MELMYWKYDVLVDSETGEFLESVCNCKPEDDCMFKTAWLADGSPNRLSVEQLEDMMNDLRK